MRAPATYLMKLCRSLQMLLVRSVGNHEGVTIGKGSTVGAASVVTKDVPEYTVVAGNPARVLRKIDLSTRPEPQQT